MMRAFIIYGAIISDVKLTGENILCDRRVLLAPDVQVLGVRVCRAVHRDGDTRTGDLSHHLHGLLSLLRSLVPSKSLTMFCAVIIATTIIFCFSLYLYNMLILFIFESAF